MEIVVPAIYTECRSCEARLRCANQATDYVRQTPQLLEGYRYPRIVIECIPTKSIRDNHSVERWLAPSLEMTGNEGEIGFELPDMRTYTNCPGMVREKQNRVGGNASHKKGKL